LPAAADVARGGGTPPWVSARAHWLDRLLGPERDETPGQAHAGWIRRLSPLESTYTRARSVEVCLATLRAMGFDLDAEKGIRPDLEDRPQKPPRACVIAADRPRGLHLVTRAPGGLHAYEVLLE